VPRFPLGHSDSFGGRAIFSQSDRYVIERRAQIVDCIADNQSEAIWRLGVSLPVEDVHGTVAFDDSSDGVWLLIEEHLYFALQCVNVFLHSR
jgi:hypothetical protein